jgi:hypothetical protein
MFLGQLVRLLVGAVELGCGLVLLLLLAFGISLIANGLENLGIVIVAGIVVFVSMAIKNRNGGW